MASATATFVEYDVRTLDAHGDAISVTHFTREQKQAAVQEAIRLYRAGAVAVAVERHAARYPAFSSSDPDKYETVLTLGDRGALEAWKGGAA